MKPATKKIILGQPSWRITTREVEAFVTETGGQIAPATFDLDGRKIAPMSVAPWATEKLDPATPAIIKALRGDFFCMPFGGNSSPYGKERHPVHGEVANAKWKLESASSSSLHCSLKTRIRTGRVDKHVTLVLEHRAIYQRHVISQMTGPMTIGHHAMLKFPHRMGSGIVSTSPFRFGQVFPEPVERPENRGYSILKPGATFDSLSHVPTITGEMADLSQYPAQRGFEDLVMLVADDRHEFAWSAVVFPHERYVWFAIKDPKVLASTILWISNGGRHYAPWNGRHVNVLGIEEVTANFHYGLKESAAVNDISHQGFRTTIKLNAHRPTLVNYIFGVASIPKGFDRVDRIERAKNGIELISASGRQGRAAVDVDYLFGGAA